MSEQENHDEQEKEITVEVESVFLDLYFTMLSEGVEEHDIFVVLERYTLLKHLESLSPLEAHHEISYLLSSGKFDNTPPFDEYDDDIIPDNTFADEDGEYYFDELSNLERKHEKSLKDIEKQKKQINDLKNNIKALQEENRKLSSQNYDLQIDVYLQKKGQYSQVGKQQKKNRDSDNQ